MPIESNTRVDIPPFALKLVSKFPDKQGFGTGFVVDYKTDSWLFTCWHNIGPVSSKNKVDITGEVTATHIGFCQSGVLMPLEGRRIVGVNLANKPVDIAAIELLPGEKPPPPWFEAKRDMTLEGIDLPKDFQLGGKSGGEKILVPIERHYFWQGFPGAANMSPVSFRAVDFAGLTSHHDWMLRYMPGGSPGASGCPVIQLRAQGARIAGIHVHYNTRLIKLRGRSIQSGMPRVADVSLEWGTAVPVEILYRAIDRASTNGVSIVPFDAMVEPD